MINPYLFCISENKKLIDFLLFRIRWRSESRSIRQPVHDG